MTWNVFGPNPGDNGAMFARVNLRDLAKGRFNYQYIFDSSRINTSPAQSTRGRAFISGHKDAGALRILYADDASMLAFDRVVPHPTTRRRAGNRSLPVEATGFRGADSGGGRLRCAPWRTLWGGLGSGPRLVHRQLRP